MQVSGLVVHRCLPLALVRWAPGRRWEHPSLQKVRMRFSLHWSKGSWCDLAGAWLLGCCSMGAGSPAVPAGACCAYWRALPVAANLIVPISGGVLVLQGH